MSSTDWVLIAALFLIGSALGWFGSNEASPMKERRATSLAVGALFAGACAIFVVLF